MGAATTFDEIAAALGRLLDRNDVRTRGERLGLTWTPQPEIGNLRRLSAGASRETWTFEVTSDSSPGGEPIAFVLQRAQPGVIMDGPSPATEAMLLGAARQRGVPVAAVVADPAACADELGPGLVCTHVAGETLGSRVVRDDEYAAARSCFAADAAHALAAIHSIDPDGIDGLAPVDTLGRLRLGLDALEVALPAFELALRWLQENQPADGARSVVHGDFRLGNLVVDQNGLRAVLDWELAHIGDPLEDLGWLCVRAWRFGGAGEVAGVAELEDLLDAYQAATGRPVDAEAVHWWIVAGTLTWGLICAVQAHRHLDGHVRSVELAAIGRRVCETEYDLLNLLYSAQAGQGTDHESRTIPGGEGGDSQPCAHGRPTAAELIGAVREHLITNVAGELSGSASYHLKVAANALKIVERELTLAPGIDGQARQLLASLEVADEASLAHSLRDGTVDATSTDVLRVVRALVVNRVAVANPRWLIGADEEF